MLKDGKDLSDDEISQGLAGLTYEITENNAAKQVPINLDWYIKNEEKAAALYQNMLTE